MRKKWKKLEIPNFFRSFICLYLTTLRKVLKLNPAHAAGIRILFLKKYSSFSYHLFLFSSRFFSKFLRICISNNPAFIQGELRFFIFVLCITKFYYSKRKLLISDLNWVHFYSSKNIFCLHENGLVLCKSLSIMA